MLVAPTSVVGFNYNLPPPTLSECRHRGLARLRIAVRGACDFSWISRLAKDQQQPPPGQCRSWQGRLRDLAAKARLAKVRQP